MNETSSYESSSTNDEKIKTKKFVSIESDDENYERNSIQKQHLEKSHPNSQSFSKKDQLKRNKNKNKKPRNRTNSERNLASKKENGYAHIPNRYFSFIKYHIALTYYKLKSNTQIMLSL